MNQSKLDNSIAEIKTNPEAMNCRLNNAEERISDLEDRMMEITKSEQQTERQMKKKKQTKKPQSNIQDLWDNIKHTYAK